jgi:hypothetical protein
VFNAANPSGTYTLDLSEPYGQMVCEEIIYLANYRAGCALNSVKHMPKGSSKYKTVTLARPTPKTALHQRKCVTSQKAFAKQMLVIVGKKMKASYSEKKRKSVSDQKRSNLSVASVDTRPGSKDNSRPGSKNDAKSDSRQMRRMRTEEEMEVAAASTSYVLPVNELEVDVQKAADLCKTILEQFDLFPDDSVHQDIVYELLGEMEQKLMECASKVEFKEDFMFSVLYHIFFALFELNDTDHSGDMDIEEFLNCILCVGVQFDRKYAMKLLRDFDVDKSGFIDNQEFAMIMVNEFCRLDISRDEFVDAATKQSWIIPSSGEVIMDVHYQCEMPSIYDVSHDEGILGVIKCIREVQTEEQRETIFLNATTSPYFYMSAQQALMLFEEMGKHDESRLDVLSRVLPQLVSAEQCLRFIDSVLNAEGKFALRVKMGQSYNVFMGLYSGHYTYDLKHVQKQQEGRALSAIWSEEMLYMKKHKCDTSQRGNYSNFRNETMSGIPTAITSSWFAGCPNAGKLRLDYVSTMRPKQGNWPLSKKRFQSMKDMLGLASVMEIFESKDYSRIKKKASAGTGGGRPKKAFYRLPTMETPKDDDDDTKELPVDSQTARRSSRPANVLSLEAQLQEVGDMEEGDSALTLGSIKEFYVEYMETCHHYHSIYPEERQRDISRSDYDPNVRPMTPESLRDTDKKPSMTKYHKIFPYAYMKLLKLQLALPAMFLSIDQVVDIIQMFPAVDYLRECYAA